MKRDIKQTHKHTDIATTRSNRPSGRIRWKWLTVYIETFAFAHKDYRKVVLGFGKVFFPRFAWKWKKIVIASWWVCKQINVNPSRVGSFVSRGFCCCHPFWIIKDNHPKRTSGNPRRHAADSVAAAVSIAVSIAKAAVVTHPNTLTLFNSADN